MLMSWKDNYACVRGVEKQLEALIFLVVDSIINEAVGGAEGSSQ